MAVQPARDAATLDRRLEAAAAAAQDASVVEQALQHALHACALVAGDVHAVQQLALRNGSVAGILQMIEQRARGVRVFPAAEAMAHRGPS
jgi:hypothetical protein